MLIKNFGNCLMVLTSVFTLSQCMSSLVFAQGQKNFPSTSKKTVKSSTAQSKNSKTISHHRHTTKISQEEVTAAGIESNKFYSQAEKQEKAGKLDEAKALYYKAALRRSEVWGQYDPSVANISIKIGQIELRQKHPNAARTWFKQALKALSHRYGSGDYELVPVLTMLAQLEASGADHEAACSYYQHVLLLKERKFGEENAQIVPTRILYIEQLIADKDPKEAAQVATKGIEIEKKVRGAGSENLPKLEQLLTIARTTTGANNSSK